MRQSPVGQSFNKGEVGAQGNPQGCGPEPRRRAAFRGGRFCFNFEFEVTKRHFGEATQTGLD